MQAGTRELLILKERLSQVFEKVYDSLKDKRITNRTLDNQVLTILRQCTIKEEDFEMHFSEPRDEIYTVEGGRTPYDVLCCGKVNNKRFRAFINNKFGDIHSSTRNDVTTYNNLLRLYLSIKEQRLTHEITLNKRIIYDRIAGNEILTYAMFVVDRRKRGYRFFLLEEVADDFYVNPRNTMFQVRYSPQLRDPRSFYDFVIELINATVKALETSLRATQTEISILKYIKIELTKIKEGHI